MTIAPHAPYTVNEEHLAICKSFSEEFDIPVHIHLHETSAEAVDSELGTPSMSRHSSVHKCRPFKNLDRLGLVNNKLIAVHMTQLNDREIDRCAEQQVNIVHCPCSNLKLASGFCPVASLVKSGVNVCIGTDSTASNNSLDLWNEVRVSSMLSKAVANDASAVTAYESLKMVTINGARALGLEVCLSFFSFFNIRAK